MLAADNTVTARDSRPLSATSEISGSGAAPTGVKSNNKTAVKVVKKKGKNILYGC